MRRPPAPRKPVADYTLSWGHASGLSEGSPAYELLLGWVEEDVPLELRDALVAAGRENVRLVRTSKVEEEL